MFEESLSDIQKQNAKAENINIENLDDPCEIDNHQIHVEEHSKFLLTNKLQKTDKDKLLSHINKHKQLTN